MQFHGFCNKRLLLLLATHRQLFVGLCLTLASTLVGCSSLPTTSGSWVGSISTETLYANDEVFRVPVMHAIDGDDLSPSLGYTLVLVDQNYNALDAADFASGSFVKVTGDVQREQIIGPKGQFLNREMGVPSTIELYTLVKVKTITNMADGKDIKPRHAIAIEPMPTTQSSAPVP